MFKYPGDYLFNPAIKDPPLSVFLSKIGQQANLIATNYINSDTTGQFYTELRHDLGKLYEEAYYNLEATQNIEYGEIFGSEYINWKPEHQVKMFLCNNFELSKKKRQF